MKAVIFGTGRIACGCAGDLLHAAGFDLVFVGRNADVVAHLNRLGRYRVRLIDAAECRDVTIDRVRAVPTTDADRVAAEVADADLIITSVGAANLGDIAPLIASGLARRQSPATVLAFENLANSGSTLRTIVGRHLPRTRKPMVHGFASALVERIVSVRIGDPDGDEPLVFVGDTWPTVRVDARGLRAPMPPIESLIVADNYDAWVYRKLYVYSAGHATAAYLGHLKGYHYVHAAVRDSEIRAAVLDAMAEGQRGLRARYGAAVAGGREDLLAVLTRFENAALRDPVLRVGRDPGRKLAIGERLIGAARLAERAGVKPDGLALATAAALYFDPSDPSAAALQRQLHDAGAAPTVKNVSGIDTRRGVGRMIVSDCRQLARGWQPGNLVLSLSTLMWAWAA